MKICFHVAQWAIDAADCTFTGHRIIISTLSSSPEAANVYISLNTWINYLSAFKFIFFYLFSGPIGCSRHYNRSFIILRFSFVFFLNKNSNFSPSKNSKSNAIRGAFFCVWNTLFPSAKGVEMSMADPSFPIHRDPSRPGRINSITAPIQSTNQLASTHAQQCQEASKKLILDVPS